MVQFCIILHLFNLLKEKTSAGSNQCISQFCFSMKDYKKLIDQISSNPRVVTTGYKMTDGRSIGITVKLQNGDENWFFPEEIEKG